MKIIGSEYSIEELILILGLLVFFAIIFVGAFNYNPQARLFPLMLSTPAIVLIIIYLLRGLLPDRIIEIIEQSDRFAITKSDDDKKEEASPKPKGDRRASGFDFRVYFIFCYTFLFIISSYLIGFYGTTLLLLVLYLVFVRRETSYRKGGGVLLTAGLLFLIFLFDKAFGYHFSEGVLLSLPPF